jgi:outer membrane usher protein
MKPQSSLIKLVVFIITGSLGLSSGSAGSPGETLLQVVVNGESIGEVWPVHQAAASRFYVPESFFTAARLKLPATPPNRTSGGNSFAVCDIPDSQCILDAAQQTLRITVPGTAFVGTLLNGMQRAAEAPDVSRTGAFLNHDIQVSGGQGRSTSVSGIIEAGFFGPLGVFTTEFLAHDLVSSVHATRLNTQFSRDFPDRRETLAVGDSLSASAPWARQVYYGGICFASKLPTQPEFVPQALPSLSGMAVAPSVVDIYADNVKQLSTSVPQGPFAVNNIPVLSGQGTISMVVTDLLGRQQIITQSYSTSILTLRKGVQQFTYEGGAIRNNYGFSSSSYRGLFADATVRRGVTDSITVNARTEVHPRGETAGAGADFRLPFAIVGGGVAGSMSDGRAGTLAYAEISRSSRAFGVSAQYQWATSSFTQLGLAPLEKPVVRQVQGSLSRSLTRRLNLGGGYLQRDGRTTPDVRAISGSLSASTGRGVLTVSANRSLLSDRTLMFSVTMVLPIGRKSSVTVSAVREGNGTSGTLGYSKQLGSETGYGYRVQAGTSTDRAQAEFSYQNDEGVAQVELDNTGGATAWRASQNGGLVFMDGHLLASRWLNDSFAVVEMPNGDGIEVSANNQPVTRMGSNGVALVPWLAAYEQNSIQVDGDALPMDIAVDQTRQTVVPMPRSGVLVKFVPTRTGGAVVRLVTADGQPVPGGASLTVEGGTEAFLVALRGEVYIPTLRFPARLTVQWDEHLCVAKVPNDASSVLPRIGPLLCEAVAGGHK